MHFKNFFGFKKTPFENELPVNELFKLPSMVMAKERIDYIIGIGGIMVLTGEVGSGKSTSLRYAISHYNSSQYKIVDAIAHDSQITDFYKQLCWAIGINMAGASRAFLIKSFKNAVREIATAKKQKVLLIVDEANLLRAEIFAELHLLSQFDNDSKNFIGIVLAGQNSLLDKLSLRTSAATASRVIARTHLTAINKDEMHEYIHHHTNVCGLKKRVFSDQAIMAIQQGSGGILRKANSLARGGLVAATGEKKEEVTAEHIRLAATELL